MSKPVPSSVIFFPNGMAAVCDGDGNQIGEYQGRHADAIASLAAAGYDWRKPPEILEASRRQAPVRQPLWSPRTLALDRVHEVKVNS